MNHEDITNGLESPPPAASTSECCNAKVDLLASIPLCVQCNGELVAPRLTGKHYEVFPGRHLPGHNERCGLEWPKPPRDLAAVIDAMLAEIPEREEFLRAALKQEKEIAARYAERDLSQRNNLVHVAEILVAVVGGPDEPWREKVMAIWSGEAANGERLAEWAVSNAAHEMKTDLDREMFGTAHVHGPECASDGWTADPGDERPMDPEMAKAVYGDYPPPVSDRVAVIDGQMVETSPVGDTPNLAGEAWAGDDPRIGPDGLELGEDMQNYEPIIDRIEVPMRFNETVCADCGGPPQIILLAQNVAKCVRCFILSGMNAKCFMCGKNPTEAIVRAVHPEDGKDDTVGTCIECLLKHVSAGRN